MIGGERGVSLGKSSDRRKGSRLCFRKMWRDRSTISLWYRCWLQTLLTSACVCSEWRSLRIIATNFFSLDRIFLPPSSFVYSLLLLTVLFSFLTPLWTPFGPSCLYFCSSLFPCYPWSHVGPDERNWNPGRVNDFVGSDSLVVTSFTTIFSVAPTFLEPRDTTGYLGKIRRLFSLFFGVTDWRT